MGFTDALELAAGDYVEASALFREEAEDGEGGVGFDGVADGVGAGLREGLVEELEALRYLAGGVDVERGSVLVGEGGERDAVAVEGAVAVGEGAGGWLRAGGGLCLRLCGGFRQGSGVLSVWPLEALWGLGLSWRWGWRLSGLLRHGVGGFGDDDPGDEVGEESAAAEEDAKDENEADDGDVPAVVLGDAGADAGDHAVVMRAVETREGRRAGTGVSRWGAGCSAGGTETAAGWDLIAAMSAEHGILRR